MSDMLELRRLRKPARTWTRKAQFVSLWGFLARNLVEAGPIGIARRDEPRYDTPGPLRPANSDFCGISEMWPEPRTHRNLNRTRSISKRHVVLSLLCLASLLWGNFSSLISALTRKCLVPRLTDAPARQRRRRQRPQRLPLRPSPVWPQRWPGRRPRRTPRRGRRRRRHRRRQRPRPRFATRVARARGECLSTPELLPEGRS